MAILITLILTLSTTAILGLQQTVEAHNVFTTHAYCYATPLNPGVGQSMLIYGWLDYTIEGVLITNNIRFENYQFIITAPNGTTQTFNFPTVSDPTSSQYFHYTPTEVGNYTVAFYFPGQTWNYASQYPSYSAYEGDYYSPSNATYTWTVTQTPATSIQQNPLPTDYWSTPVNEEQNVNFAFTEEGNWLGGSAQSSGLMSNPLSYIQYNGAAPLTSHVMWTSPIEFGGFIGGQTEQPQLPGGLSAEGAAITSGNWYTGMAYNIRFPNPMIISGVLYYQLPEGYSATGGGEVAVNLQTDQVLWKNTASTFYPTFAQIDDADTPNGYGAGGAILWQVSGTTWIGYDAFNGNWEYNITSVPSGTQIYQNNGEIDKYVFSYSQTTHTGWLALWNETSLFSVAAGATESWPGPGLVFNGASASAYTWNYTITANLNGQFGVQPSIVGVVADDAILGMSSSVGTTSLPSPNTNPWTIWALNLNQTTGTIGSLLWIDNLAAPPNNETEMFACAPIDAITNTFIMTIFETGQRVGFSLLTGKQLWGPVGQLPGFQYYSARMGVTYNGDFYYGGYGGTVYCISCLTGNQIWSFGNGPSGGDNSTDMQLNGPWGQYPTDVTDFGNGVVYTFSGEHSPESPLYNGELTRALNATTGQQIWSLLSWSACGLGNSMQSFPISDGYGVLFNCYDNQLYCVGQGPSQTTVTAPDLPATVGTPIVIRGTVMDISAGTQQATVKADFPNGVPCVSDADEGAFMATVYEQQPMPANLQGVPVSVYVLDSNGNYRQIGKTTTDSSGQFTLSWAPDIPGNYTVYATFAGSAAYYGSSAETSFYAISPTSTSTATPAPVSGFATQSTLMYIGAAIIVVIIIIGAVLALITLRKRP